MIKFSKDNIKTIADYILMGKIVCIPTETVYGIAVCNNYDSIMRLRLFKERDDKPFAIMLSNKDDISNYATVGEYAKRVIDKFMPGELTVVLDKKSIVMDDITGGGLTVGIRVPDDEFLNTLINLTGPLVVTSANKRGDSPCLCSEEVIEKLDFVDAVVEGECLGRIPTTVVLIKENCVEVLRKGKFEETDFIL